MVMPKDERLAAGGPGLAERLLRALALLHAARLHFGDRLAVERDSSLGSCIVWELAGRVDPAIRGFFLGAHPRSAGRIAPAGDAFAGELDIPLDGRPREEVPDADPGLRSRLAEERAKASEEGGVECWVSARRTPAPSAWFSLGEFQELGGGLFRLCPILDWSEEDVLRYAARRRISVPEPVRRREAPFLASRLQAADE